MSEKHLPGLGGSYDRIVFDGDGSVWVRERTGRLMGSVSWDLHAGDTEYEHELSCCGNAVIWSDNEPPAYCPWCGARVVD